MTLHPIRALMAHRLVRRSLTLCAAIALVTATSLPAHGLTVLLGTYTLQQDETHSSVTIGPLAAIDTNGHTLTINGNGGLSCLSLLSVGGRLHIKSAQTTPGRVVLTGAASHFIGLLSSVELMDSTASLEITTVNTTFSGLGQIVGRHPDATISIANGRKLTSRIAVLGAMTIVGPGTFRNEGLLRAHSALSTNAKITLAEDLSLEDDTNATWDATAAELEFNHAQTGENGLLGFISVRQLGVLDFRASIDCELLQWVCGTLAIATDETLTYQQFALGGGGCKNPDSSGPPYSITGSYDVQCIFC